MTIPERQSTVEELLPEYQERLYPPTEARSMFLAQALNQDLAYQKAVNDAMIKRIMR